MAVLSANIESVSLAGFGVIAQGGAALKQLIKIALFTTRGSDPLRPEFGSNIYKLVDSPQTVSVPQIKAEILETLEMWVPEIRVTNIQYVVTGMGSMAYEISFTITDSDVAEKVLVNLEGSEVSTAINEFLLTAAIPDNPYNDYYKFYFEINGNLVPPLPDADGFATIDELFAFVKNNYDYAGRWMMEDERILLFMKGDDVSSANMAIALNPISYITTPIPVLETGYKYKVTLTKNGGAVLPQMPVAYTTAGDVLNWLKTNLPVYRWKLIYTGADYSGLFFSNEFSSEFNKPGTGYSLAAVVDKENVYSLKIDTV